MQNFIKMNNYKIYEIQRDIVRILFSSLKWRQFLKLEIDQCEGTIPLSTNRKRNDNAILREYA